MHFSADHQLFIADLHLQQACVENIELALGFLEKARGVNALYIIGDLFEYWLGDDAQDPAMGPVSDALTQLSASGTALHLMHGNRDFLLGHRYANQIGATLHTQDEILIELAGEPVLLLHGDTLCTDDTDYQALRAMLRDEQWQSQFLALSIEQRIEQANALRDKSRAAVSEKRADIMDVNSDAVQAAFDRTACKVMIHGHTHRPADHQTAANQNRRLVLGDWRKDHAQFALFNGEQLVCTQFPFHE